MKKKMAMERERLGRRQNEGRTWYLGRAESGQAGIWGSSGRGVIETPAEKRTVLTDVPCFDINLL